MSAQRRMSCWPLPLLLGILSFSTAASMQRGDGPLEQIPPKDGLSAEDVVARIIARETEFQASAGRYSWRQHIVVQTIDDYGTVTGRYESIVDHALDKEGHRVQNVIFAPQPSLSMTREDFDQINRLAPFLLSREELGEHRLGYAGRQRVDEVETYVFFVAPRHVVKGKRYFEGQIWVDDRDFQVVRATGKSVPEVRVKRRKALVIDQLFPTTTSWRQKVDDWWFPAYVRGDEELDFGRGSKLRVRLTVRYTGHRKADQQMASQQDEPANATVPK